MDVCRLRIPKQELEDWTEYLYHMTLLVVISGIEIGQRNTLSEYGDKYSNLYIVGNDFYVGSGYTMLTREQWIEEIEYLCQESQNRYQYNNPGYHKEMEKNYPEFDAALEYLRQNVKTCEVVRMNKHGGDESVWYFAKEESCFCIMCISDAM